MNCPKAEKEILKSVDGRLDRRATELLGKHLEACPGCRKAEKDYRVMFSLLRDGRADAPLPGFW